MLWVTFRSSCPDLYPWGTPMFQVAFLVFCPYIFLLPPFSAHPYPVCTLPAFVPRRPYTL